MVLDQVRRHECSVILAADIHKGGVCGRQRHLDGHAPERGTDGGTGGNREAIAA